MSGYVYFILCTPMEAVKIGFTSNNPHARMKSLQTGCPAPLKLAAFSPGTQEDERKLHEAFAPLSIQGEWFRFEAKLRDFVWYLTDVDPELSSREMFEAALHDVLMFGMWMPDHTTPESAYNASATCSPFRALIAAKFGPFE